MKLKIFAGLSLSLLLLACVLPSRSLEAGHHRHHSNVQFHFGVNVPPPVHVYHGGYVVREYHPCPRYYHRPPVHVYHAPYREVHVYHGCPNCW